MDPFPGLHGLPGGYVIKICTWFVFPGGGAVIGGCGNGSFRQ